MACSSCEQSEASGRDSCAVCGVSLRVSCPSCAARNPLSANYCSTCSYPLRKPDVSRPQRAHDVGLKSERKVVTVLFADIVDSTASIYGLDPEDADAVLAPALNG